MSRQYKSSDEVPNAVLAARLRELCDVITKPKNRESGERLPYEFYMRIPAEVDHDADLVMSEAARRLLAPHPDLAGVEVVPVGARELLDEAAAILASIRGSDFHGIVTDDVLYRGKATNWFDARKKWTEALGLLGRGPQ
jgi:hypothetical protein